MTHPAAGRTQTGMEHTSAADLTAAFEHLVKAASDLLLAFHLDLASATVSLARRVRAASTADASLTDASTEAASMAGTAETLSFRAAQLASPAAAAHLDAASRLLAAHRSDASAALPELLAA